MNEESKQPKEYDLVLGGNNPPPLDGLVLGGIEGVRHRLSSQSENVVIAAVKDAINYGKEGEDLLFEIIETKSNKLLWGFLNYLYELFNENQKKKLVICLSTLFKNYDWHDWRGRNLNTKINLSGLDFSKIDLVEVNLSQVNLNKANFQGANLGGVNFNKANLSETNLKEVYLEFATLQETNLTKANLTNAYLGSANLKGANLSESILDNIDWNNAILEETNLSNTNLAHANLSSINMKNCNLTNANLANADIDGANLAYAKLEGTNLDNVYTEYAEDLSGTVLLNYLTIDEYYEGSWE